MNTTEAPVTITTTNPYENITTATCRIVVSTSNLSLTVLSCVMSIIGSVVIFVTFAKLPQIRNFPRKLLIALTVADLLTAIGNLLGTVRYIVLMSGPNGCELVQVTDATCQLQSFITTFSSMASFFWTTIIALHILLQVQYGSARMRTGRMMVAYQLLCWGVPGAITITASALDVLGSDNSVGTGSWCWIKSNVDDSVQIFWMVLAGKGWEILCYVLSATFFILVKQAIYLKRKKNDRQGFKLSDVVGFRVEDRNFLFVPLLLYVLRFWGTLRFFLAVTTKHVNNVHLNRTQTALLALQGLGDSGQAFCNCIVFCLCDTPVRNYLCSKIRRRPRDDRINEIEDERTPII